MRTCAVNLCSNTSINSTVTFYKFPKKQSQFDAWIDFCKNGNQSFRHSNNLHICESHFSPDIICNNVRHVLKQNTIPLYEKPAFITIKFSSGSSNRSNKRFYVNRNFNAALASTIRDYTLCGT